MTMFSSLNLRKLVRLSATSAAAGATIALVFLGGPADAAEVVGYIKQGRGF
jgi:hypothetical protein